MKYLVVIEKGPTSYGAYVPDLPGCVAVSKTKRQVKRLIREAKLLELSPLDLARLAWIVETLDPGITGDREDVLPLILAAESAADHGDPDLALSLLSAAAANSFWAKSPGRYALANSARCPAACWKSRIFSALGK